MSDNIEIDMSQVREYAVNLEGKSSSALKGVPAVIKKGALNIKNQLISEMRTSSSFKYIAHDIDFDITDGGFGASIGPSGEPGAPGNLANIAYFGSSRGGGTVPDPSGALEAEIPNLEEYILKALGEAL